MPVLTRPVRLFSALPPRPCFCQCCRISLVVAVRCLPRKLRMNSSAVWEYLARLRRVPVALAAAGQPLPRVLTPAGALALRPGLPAVAAAPRLPGLAAASRCSMPA